jgi:hypothetical protein
MAIARRPASNQSDIDSFISGASRPAPPKEPPPVAKKENRVAAIVRFPPDMLKRIDAAAKQRGISRSAWMLSVASKALDTGEW